MPMIGGLEDAPQAGLCCPRCAAVNLPQRKFCAKCGSPLWEACLRCNELCAAGEIYCGGCGANLADAAADVIERIEADFRAAAEMQADCRFDHAIAQLAPVSKHTHPRLVEYATRAKQLLHQLAVERDQRRKAAEEECRRARQLYESFDFDGAAGILEAVPPSLRNNDILELGAQVAARREEIAALGRELREAVASNRLAGILPTVERLLSLKPDDAYAHALADRLQEQLVAAAEKRLAEHHYDQAVRLLEQIATCVRTPRAGELYRQAKELAALAWDLRHAPIIDAALVAVARRLQEMAPDDLRAARVCQELHRRAGRAPAGKWQEPLPWARPPQPTALGVPIEGLTGFQRLLCADSAELSVLRRQPGRFAVACGLALAGIEKAALEINLAPAREQGVLRRAARLMRSRTAHTAWGIDVGSSALKAIRLVWDSSQQQAIIQAAVLVEHAKPLTYAAHDAEKRNLVADTLKTFLDGQDLKTARVCVGLPGRTTLSRQIDLPPVDAAKASKLVQMEAPHQFPFPLEELNWDFRIFDDPVPDPTGTATSGQQNHRAILIAAKRTTTHHFLDAFRGLGVPVDLLQPDFVALHNFLIHDCFAAGNDAPASEGCRVVAALDVGCEVTNLVVSSPHSLWFRSCGVAGHSFTRALVKDFNLSIAQAEQRKRAPESADRLSDFGQTLSPVFDDLLKELQQLLAVYARSQPDHPVERVLGLGGGFSLHGLFRHLRCGR
jgi:type IV pilus assembly protein PilM